MPIVATIDGIKIQVYWDEHPPPHFHAEYAKYRAQSVIDTLSVMKGYIPNAQYRKVVAWAKSRKEELHRAYILCESDLHPGKIK